MLLGSDLENTCTSACEETHYCQSFTVCRVWDYCYYKLFDARDTHTVSLSLSYNKEVAQIRHETTPGIDHEANGGGGGGDLRKALRSLEHLRDLKQQPMDLAKLIRVLKQVISTNIRHLPFTSTK